MLCKSFDELFKEKEQAYRNELVTRIESVDDMADNIAHLSRQVTEYGEQIATRTQKYIGALLMIHATQSVPLSLSLHEFHTARESCIEQLARLHTLTEAYRTIHVEKIGDVSTRTTMNLLKVTLDEKMKKISILARGMCTFCQPLDTHILATYAQQLT